MGYVGLVTSACLAQWGNEVVGIEADGGRLEKLRQGEIPFHEPGLADLVRANGREGRLRFTHELADVVGADAVFVAVGTHDGSGGWQSDTLAACVTQVLPLMGPGSVLVIRSTVPPDFVEELRALAGAAAQGGRGVAVLLNPEFTREGTAVNDFFHPDRVVVGVLEDSSGTGVGLLRELYGLVDVPFLVLPAIDAALTKLGSNLFLATKISFANELAAVCELYGASMDGVLAGMAPDPRIGGRFLRPGVGFGGSCLPNQVRMTVMGARDRQAETPLLAAVDAVNARQADVLVEKLEKALGDLHGRRIAVLGLAFKPDTDDTRDAPSLRVIRLLHDAGARVRAFDPMAAARSRVARMLPEATISLTVHDALFGADAAALVTEWRDFIELDWAAARRLMHGRVFVDGRNALSPEEMARAGFVYSSFGRPAPAPSETVSLRVPRAVGPATEPPSTGLAPALASRARDGSSAPETPQEAA
jgi:UDPglucose 6-dehydrogenase